MKPARLTFLLIVFVIPFWAQQKDILAAHNSARAKAGTPPLVWSDSLAKIAQQWADTLLKNGKFEHRPNSKYGENLFEIRGATASPTQVVASWVDEQKDFDAASNACRSGAVCGHYTQVVWKSTRQVGCAVARQGARREVWDCNYDPPGNFVGRGPF
jgi:uncharacterized protein YkwD